MPNTCHAALRQVKQSERAWAGGRRSYAAHVLREAARELGVDDAEHPEAVIAHLLTEREAAIAQLEDLCHNFGDDDWTSDLWLPDIIDKHLGKYLHAARPEGSSPAGGERQVSFRAIGEELRQPGCIGQWKGIKDGALYGLGLPPGAAGAGALAAGLSRHCQALRDGKFEARVVGGDFHARYVPGKLDLTKKL